jgi:itaconyl-CoA hydratase
LRARSTVTMLRASGKDPKVGIATWHTQGFNQRDELVCEFVRSNRFNRRPDADNKPTGKQS